jgi:sugar phosphate isomerase/epimerase
MQRRSFLKTTAAGAALLGGGLLAASCGRGSNGDTAPRTQMRLGVQLFTLRSQLQSDVRKTLADVAAIGYEEVELFGFGSKGFIDDPLFGLSPREFRAALTESGLSAPIAHISGDTTNIPEIADVAQEIGIRYLVVAMAPDFLSFENGEFKFLGVTGRDQVDRIAERLNQQGEMARAAGIGFGYHNHQMEFASLGDVNAFDYLFAQADAGLVKMELDIGWALVAGADPDDVLQRYAGRVIAVHLKDYDPSRPLGDDPALYPVPIQAQIIEPGAGPTDFGPIMATLERTGVAHRFVEVDATPEPLAAITRGYGYLTGL